MESLHGKLDVRFLQIATAFLPQYYPRLLVAAVLFDCVEEDWSLSSMLRVQREMVLMAQSQSIFFHVLVWQLVYQQFLSFMVLILPLIWNLIQAMRVSMGWLFCNLSQRGQREAECKEWHGQATENAEQNPTGVMLYRHPPSTWLWRPKSLLRCTRPSLQSISEKLMGLVSTSAGFNAPFIFLTAITPLFAISCNQRYLTSRCRILPIPWRFAIACATVASTCSLMSASQPMSLIIDLMPINSAAAFLAVFARRQSHRGLTVRPRLDDGASDHSHAAAHASAAPLAPRPIGVGVAHQLLHHVVVLILHPRVLFQVPRRLLEVGTASCRRPRHRLPSMLAVNWRSSLSLAR